MKQVKRSADISTATHSRSKRRHRSRRTLVNVVSVVCAILLISIGLALWLGSKASAINRELTAAIGLVSPLKKSISNDDPEAASKTVARIREHTSAASHAAGDPIWTLASTLPVIGPNLTAVSEVARSADDVASLGLAPLTKVFSSLNWDSLIPSSSPTDLEPLKAASPSIMGAAHAVSASADRLDSINHDVLLPQVAEPLVRAKEQLQEVTGALNTAAVASQIAPGMLGSDGPREYLLIVQNNAETRASGGIPGALAILTIDQGQMTLGTQSSATEVGSLIPPLAVDVEQQQIYSTRLGKFMQDVNLTPDFPTAASTAQAMWEKKTGQQVSGVISIDPVAMGYILDATGPVTINEPDLLATTGGRLPGELNGQNIVHTLLSTVYSEIEQPKRQDAYFAGVARETFSALSAGRADPKKLLEGISRGAEEGRVLIWSSRAQEQALIARYPLSGSVSGPSISPAQFGVYFNDGTGAKMDFYVERTVQLIKECPNEGYEQVTVRVTSTNNAPADAASSLPAYVTGDGIYGVSPGSVQTNVVAYGPVQALVESAKLDGQRTGFAPYIHNNRPVGVLAVQLAPGESKTVEFTFGKIVQHTEPNVVVTPTVRPVKEVILDTKSADCG